MRQFGMHPKWGAERQIRKLMVVSGANNGY